MSYYLEMKYINLVASRLDKFAWKRANLATCRCPMCGDSKKNKNKTRFFFFEQKGKFFVKCHNCSYSTTFPKFLEKVGGALYQDFTVEIIKDKIQSTGPTASYRQIEKTFAKMQKPEFSVCSDLQACTKISELSDTHPAKMYIANRKIPQRFWNRLYYSSDFNNTAFKNFNEKRGPNDERIVIPFYNQQKKLFAMQGRALDPQAEVRYITVRDPEQDDAKIFGLDMLDDSRKNYCFEGPIDSMFIENSVAMAGSTVNLKKMPFCTEHTVFVYDNEPRNREIVETMQDVIDCGYKICIWPSTISQKDVNDMVRDGIENVQEIIDSNTYQGLAASLNFSKWKKI